MEPDNLKTAICDALATFIRSRPGFDPHNYGDAASYRADQRTAARQKNDAETMLAAVRWRDSITGADLIEAARGGRLAIELLPAGETIRGVFMPSPVPGAPPRVRIDYCTGQYYPTEYRAGVCRALASALWNYARDNMPAPYMHKVEWPDGKTEAVHVHAAAEARTQGAYVTDLYRIPGGDSKALSAGDYLRRKFRAEFGSALQRRWFD